MDKYLYYLEDSRLNIRLEEFKIKEESETFIKTESPYRHFEKENFYKWQWQNNGDFEIYGTDKQKIIKLAMKRTKDICKNKIEYLNDEIFSS